MRSHPTKRTLFAIAALLMLTFTWAACSNSADTSKAATDTSATSMSADTTKKADTLKMDTASTRPVKTTN